MNRTHVSRWRRLGATVATLAAASLAIAGCSAGGSSGSGAGAALTIANVAGATWTCGFNPFNPAVDQQSFGFTYEPLIYVNELKNSAETPMLATGSTWSNDYKTLTFTIRNGVKWSDGKPFTAADVAFTFNLLKKYSGLDLNAIWSSGLESVTQSGSDQVVFQFKAPAEPYFYYIADQTPIVPEHIWSTSTVGTNPVNYSDAKPVGTGPYEMSNCTPQNIRYTANPGYWQSGKPAVKTVNYPSYTDNDPANQDLADGKAQWGGQFIPSIEKYYVDRDKTDNHYWSPPVANVDLAFNLKHSVTGNLDVRQAIAYALNRNDISQVGEDGQEPAANQSGIVTPTFNSWLDTSLTSQYNYTQNTAKAEQLLSDAGYSASHPLKLTVLTVSGYTDWDASLGEIKQELAKVNVDVTVEDLAGQTYDSRLYQGDFDVAYVAETGGPTPYYELRQMLYSGNSAPLGQNASTNWMRFSDPTVDSLIEQYASASSAQQHTIVDQLQKVLLTQVPVIPTTEQVSWFQYNTKDFTGWPTQANPTALPAPYNVPDDEQLLLGLSPKK